MGCPQNGQGANLTPAQARVQLAGPVLLILQGGAVPVFPQTSIAAPSREVRILQLPGRRNRSASANIYPQIVGGRQWEKAVVPVLEDPRWVALSFRFLSPKIQRSLVGEALAQSFHAQGYGPL